MLLAIFLIVFSAIALRNIRYAAYLIIFSMPLYLWRFSVLGIPTTALEVMIYILFLAWIINKLGLLALISRNYADLTRKNAEILKFLKNRPALPLKQIKLKSRLQLHKLVYETIKPVSNCKLFRGDNFVLNIGIILLFLGAIISTSISSDIRTSLGVFKGWFFDPFLFFIVFINIIKTKKEICLSLYSWLASGVAVSVIGIFYLLNNDLTFDSRLRAFFLSPNHLAMYLSPAFLIAVWFLLENKNWKKISNIQYPIFTVIILMSLYFTHSYGAFLGLLAGGLYLALKNKSVKIKNIYFSGFVILLFFGLIFLSSNKFNQIINSSNRSSFHSRMMIWNSAGEIIKDNPLLGIGPGTFQETYLSYANKFSEPYLEWAVPQPHNIFLAFYLQTGLIGFVGFILILFWFFQRRRRCAPSRQQIDMSPSSDDINDILISLMIYILVHGLVDTTYWKNDLSLMFWLIIGGGLTTFEMYARLSCYDENESNLKTE